jgi:hypothetical protein
MGEALMTQYHLAQLNIARMLAAREDPIMADFFAQIDEINALAEKTPGFIWRLQTDEGDATALRVFDDDMMIINMSVWESVEPLYQFTYYSDHAAVYRRRQEWFHKLETPMMVMWWIPAGTVPTIEDAKAKLDYISTYGATPEAFTFKTCFDPQGHPISAKGEKVI